MQYFTEGFIPIVPINHVLITKELQDLANYSFPILKAKSVVDRNYLPECLVRLFLEEAGRAENFVQNMTIDKTTYEYKMKMLFHKVVHTDYTMTVCAMLHDMNPNRISIEKALILGLLHDIGRFGELCQTQAEKKHHAELSAEVIKLIIEKNQSECEIILKHFKPEELLEALGEHSKLYYKGENIYAKFIRDADKIAIAGEIDAQLKRFVKYDNNKGLSRKVVDIYLNEGVVHNEDGKTVGDKILKTISFINSFYFDESFMLCEKLGINAYLYEYLISRTSNIDAKLLSVAKERLGIR